MSETVPAESRITDTQKQRPGHRKERRGRQQHAREGLGERAAEKSLPQPDAPRQRPAGQRSHEAAHAAQAYPQANHTGADAQRSNGKQVIERLQESSKEPSDRRLAGKCP
jgi:hypothetical protein